tara:strand:- start:273 stop:770 length:498 start_codon:yes stop_codon:yes gene_type:complete
MKITRQKLRQIIKEEYIKEIYGDGPNDLGVVPPSGEPTSSDKDFYRYYNVQGKTPQSFQPKEVQEIVKLFCPSGESNEDSNMMAIELYNDLSNTTLSLSTSGDNIFIEGSIDDMKKFMSDFEPLREGGLIHNLELIDLQDGDTPPIIQMSCNKEQLGGTSDAWKF